MDMTPEEAQASLAAVQHMTLQTQKALYREAGYFPIIWGLVWLGGFLSSQFLQSAAVITTWVVLILLGGIASGIIGARLGKRVRSKTEARVGIFFGALICYTYLWVWVAHPLSLMQIELLVTLAIMFGFVGMGLWVRSSFAIAMGLAVSVLALAGFYALPAYFGIWMAVLGGCTFIGAGCYELVRCGRQL